ncbi:MAG: hypothetical protein ABSD57_09770 [Verrucomicrobiota bacterium]|jgi:hypothetical protein
MKASSIVRLSKAGRIAKTMPVPEFLTVLGLIVGTVTICATVATGQATPQVTLILKSSFWLGVFVFISLVVFLIPKWMMEYRCRTYDPNLIFNFQEYFDKIEPARSEAAKVCAEYLNLEKDGRDEIQKWEMIDGDKRDKLEPILDFFDDLGFFLKGDQFSDEVAHHYFHHWIRGYYNILKSYIKFYQESEGDQSAYVWIKPLFERTSVIEKQYESPKLLLDTKEEKIDFLRGECGDLGQ